MKGWLAAYFAVKYPDVVGAITKEPDTVKCIICRCKLSKKERKFNKAAKSDLHFCVDCVVRSNRVAAKMKRVATT